MTFFLLQILFNFFILLKFERISEFINLYDDPDNIRKTHKDRTACIGGLWIFSNLLIFFLYKILYDTYYFELEFGGNLNFLYFFLSVLFFLFLGYFDDKYSISPNLKLSLFVFLTFILIYLDKDIEIQSLVFSFDSKISLTQNWSFFFTILCFLLFINAFNMFDGVNLQSGLYTLFIFIIFYTKSVFQDLSLVILAFLPFFLILNYKSKCFLGDNGTLLLSILISYIILKSKNSYNTFYADEIFLIMMIPGLDLLRLAVYRILQKRNPFSPDRNHIHHILIKKYKFKTAICILCSVSFLPWVFFTIFKNSIILFIINLILYFYFVFFNFRSKEKNI